jgi:hypothetical protein
MVSVQVAGVGEAYGGQGDEATGRQGDRATGDHNPPASPEIAPLVATRRVPLQPPEVNAMEGVLDLRLDSSAMALESIGLVVVGRTPLDHVRPAPEAADRRPPLILDSQLNFSDELSE